MIYQLVRRDPAWRAMPWLALLSAVIWAWPPATGQFGALIVMIFFFNVGAPNRRASRFEAGLPIEGRDLLLGRTLSLLAMIWIPALAGTAGMAATRGISPLLVNPLMVGALCSLLAAVAQTIRPKELAGPKWILYPLFVLIPVVSALMEAYPMPWLVPVCGLAAVGLFAWSWMAVPRAFLLNRAAVKEGAAADIAGRTGPPTAARTVFRWAPVLRSIFCWQYLFFGIMMGLQAASGHWFLSSFWVVIGWMTPRTKMRWLWALPVSRRALLWTMLGPILAPQVLGYLVSLRSHWRTPVAEPRVVVVFGTAMLGWVMLNILLIVLLDWRGFARIPRNILSTAFAVLFSLFFGGSFAFQYFAPRRAPWAEAALVHLGRTVPVSLPALITVAVALLMVLYWGIEKVFSEPDFADKPRVSQPEAFA